MLGARIFDAGGDDEPRRALALLIRKLRVRGGAIARDPIVLRIGERDSRCAAQQREPEVAEFHVSEVST